MRSHGVVRGGVIVPVIIPPVVDVLVVPVVEDKVEDVLVAVLGGSKMDAGDARGLSRISIQSYSQLVGL